MAQQYTQDLVLDLKIQGFDKEAGAIARIDARLKELAKSKQEVLKVAKEQNKLTEKEYNQLIAIQKETNTLNEVKRQQVALLKSGVQQQLAEAGSTAQLRARNAELRKEMNQLNLSTKEGRKVFRELRVEYDANIKKVRDFDRAMSGSKTLVGEYSRGMVQGIGNMAIAGLKMIGVTKALDVFKSAAEIVANFDQSTARLAAIMRKSVKDMEALTNQAKELGATTVWTASQIVEMQTELAKLGFKEDQILASTQAIADLAAVADFGIARSAEFAGSVLRMYKLNAGEMQRVVDVFAKATTSTALTMQKLGTAFPYVGASAKVAGVSIERTAALLGVLSNRGIDASIAGTSLRNIFVELERKGLTFDEAMDKIQNSVNKSKTAFELFGKRSLASSIILSESRGEIDDLTHSFDNAAGSARIMADTMLDNVKGDITIAKSAWESFILSIEDGQGAISQAVRKVVQTFTGLVNSLRDVNNEGESFFEAWAKNSPRRANEVKDAVSNIEKYMQRNMEVNDQFLKSIEKLNDSEKKKAVEDEKRRLGQAYANDMRLKYLHMIRDAESQLTKVEKDGELSRGTLLDAVTPSKTAELQNQIDGWLKVVDIIEKKYIPSVVKAKQQSGLSDINWADDGIGDGTGGEGELNEKEREKRIKAAKEFVDYLEKLNIELIENAQQRDLAELDSWYKKENEKIKTSLVGAEKKEEGLALISLIYSQRQKEINDKYDAEEQKSKDEEAAELEKEKEEKLKAEEKFLEGLKELKGKYKADEKAEEQNELAEIWTLYIINLISYEEFLNMKKAIYQKYHKEEIAAEQNKEDLIKRGKQQAFKELGNLAKNYMSFLDAKMNEELAAAGDNEKKKDDIRKEYGKKKQIFAISEALMDQAAGIVKIWSQYSTVPPIAWLLTALTLAQTGLQIATIRKQKFATGGIVQSGSELPGSPKNGDNTLALVRPGEVILNDRQQALAGGANFFRMLGVPGFATGGVVGTPSPIPSDPSIGNNALIYGIVNGINSKNVVLNIQELRKAENELDTVSKGNLL